MQDVISTAKQDVSKHVETEPVTHARKGPAKIRDHESSSWHKKAAQMYIA